MITLPALRPCNSKCPPFVGLLSPSGSLIQKLSYDAWGNLRNPKNYSQPFSGIPRLRRGFTGHEYLNEFGLINMNGRFYDPRLGHFLSPDNGACPANGGVQMPDFSQNFNRYSYGLNNPLIYTDPDGEWIHIVIGAAIGGVINLTVKACQGKIHNFGDGLVAFGIGAAAGAVGAATGGAAFLAAGGGAAGAGGFLAGSAGGMVGTAFASPIQSIGNSMYFGDPMMTGKQYLMGIAIGGLLGGTINGGIALGNGKTFWTGDFRGTGITTPGPTPTLKLDEPKVKLNTENLRTKLLDIPETLDNQHSLVEIKGIDGQSRWISQQDLTLSPRQSLHLGNTGTRSPLTIDPCQLLNDLNKGNFQFVQLNVRNSMPIVKFNYNIGNVISQSGQNLGTTSYGTIHINSMGQVHIVPWLPR